MNIGGGPAGDFLGAPDKVSAFSFAQGREFLYTVGAAAVDFRARAGDGPRPPSSEILDHLGTRVRSGQATSSSGLMHIIQSQSFRVAEMQMSHTSSEQNGFPAI